MDKEFRIEEQESFRVVGKVLHTTNENGIGMKQVPALWGEVFQSGKHTELLAIMNQAPFGLLGVNVYNTDKNDDMKFDYYIACTTDKPVPAGMTEYVVPAATWVVFSCTTKEEIPAVEKYIVKEWQHTSEYKLLNTGYENDAMTALAPDIEVYMQDGFAEVWMAVKKK